MLVENFKFADGADVTAREPSLNAIFHKEVLKVAGEDHYVILHLSFIFAKPAYAIILDLPVKIVNLNQTEPLQLQHIVSILKHGKLRIGVEPPTKLHKYPSKVTDGPLWYHNE